MIYWRLEKKSHCDNTVCSSLQNEFIGIHQHPSYVSTDTQPLILTVEQFYIKLRRYSEPFLTTTLEIMQNVFCALLNLICKTVDLQNDTIFIKM